jgi:hypothetical protein
VQLRRLEDRSSTRAEGKGGDAGQHVAQAHVVSLPGGSVAQQPVTPPHRLRRLQHTRQHSLSTARHEQAGLAKIVCEVMQKSTPAKQP